MKNMIENFKLESNIAVIAPPIFYFKSGTDLLFPPPQDRVVIALTSCNKLQEDGVIGD
jgi:hypothetical protein